MLCLPVVLRRWLRTSTDVIKITPVFELPMIGEAMLYEPVRQERSDSEEYDIVHDVLAVSSNL